MKHQKLILSAGALAVAMSIVCAPLGQAQGKKHMGQTFQIVEASIEDIQSAYKSGKMTAHDLVQAYLDRIAAYDKDGPKINSIITINPHALEEADKVDAAFKRSGFVGPLHGIPVLVKDEIDVAGMPTTLGTLVFKDYRPPRDAFPVEKLRKAGAIILGKTTLSEYAAGDTYGSMFGITRNPYDLERTVGGSSGGSAAALAANFTTLAIGEETLASIRRPGAWNAVVALRPTPGLVSRSGMWDGYPSPVAQMGPMARTVADVAKLLDGMVGYDPEDPVTALGVGKTDGSYTRFLNKNGLKGARIGVLREPIGAQSEPDSDDFKTVDAAFEKNIAELKKAGAIIVDPIVIPKIKSLLATRTRNPIVTDQAPEDLLKYGLIPEFVGRLPVVATLEDLDELSLMRILIKPKNALVKQYQRLFEMEGVELALAEEALAAIARKAIDQTGARRLRSIMEGILLDTMFDLPGLEGVEKAVISREVVEGTAQPLYIYAARAGNAAASAS